MKNCGVGRTFKLMAERQRVWRNILMLNDSELMKRYIEDRAGKMFEVDLIRDLLTSLHHLIITPRSECNQNAKNIWHLDKRHHCSSDDFGTVITFSRVITQTIQRFHSTPLTSLFRLQHMPAFHAPHLRAHPEGMRFICCPVFSLVLEFSS